MLRLGFVVDVPDAAAVVAWQLGFFQQDLGRVSLEPEPFTSEASEEAALENGQLDAAYLDPVATVIVSQESHLDLRIVAGAASGGTELVVRRGITRPDQLKGRTLVAPPGSVQQAAADAWLHRNGLPPLTGDEAAPSTDAGVLHEFQAGAIAGGWEPAPLDAEMTTARGAVLVSGASSWPGGQFPTEVLAVTGSYLSAHPAAVAGLLEGQLHADQFLTAELAPAEAAFQQKLAATQDSTLSPGVLASSFAQVTFTYDPLEPDVLTEIRQAIAAGIVKPTADPAAIFDLSELNLVLRAADRKPVSS